MKGTRRVRPAAVILVGLALLAGWGLDDLSARELISLKSVGIDADFVMEMQELGPISAESLLEMRHRGWRGR